MTEPEPTHDVQDVDYATWGELFFAQAITAERVLAGVNVLAGQPIEVGPMGVGPGRLAKVTARGSIGTATGERTGHNRLHFHVTLPVSLEFVLDLAMDKQKFVAELSVPLVIAARARRDLAIVMDVRPPEPSAITIRLKAQGLRASVVQRAAGVEDELRRFVAKYVAREIEKPRIREVTLIDVAGAIDRAAGHLVPGGESA